MYNNSNTCCSWQLFPHFIMRSTGFSFELISRLAFCETSTDVDALIECQETIEALRTEIQTKLRADKNERTLEIRKRIYKTIKKSRFIELEESTWDLIPEQLRTLIEEWNRLLRLQSTISIKAQSKFARELEGGRVLLREIASDTSFQNAILLSSPQMYEHGVKTYLSSWQENKRPSKIRRIERQLVSYLQRFCAKNDTTSFFGPINYGDFRQPDHVSLPGPGASNVQQYRSFIAYWAVQQIADILGQDLDVIPYLCPFRLPIARLDTNKRILIIGGKHTFTINGLTTRICQRVDGQTTVAALADEMCLTVSQILYVFQQLIKLNAITLTPRVPVTVSNPIGWLSDFVGQFPQECSARERWLTVLRSFEDIQTQFSSVSLDEKVNLLKHLENQFESITKQNARRSSGEFYADRLMIYEECLGGMTPMSLGSDCLAELQRQLIPVLDVFLYHALEVYQELQKVGIDLVTRWGTNGKMSFLDFIKRFSEESIRIDPELSQVQQAIISQINTHGNVHEIQLDLNALPRVTQEQAAAMPVITSPDVMFIASDITSIIAGDFDILLSECHDTFMIWGWALLFHQNRAELEAGATTMLNQARGDYQLANVLTSSRVKIQPFEYPGPTIEITMPSNQKPTSQRISAADLSVSIVDDQLCLSASGWPDMKLYNGELHTLAHSLLALPKVVSPEIDLGTHTPRLRIYNTILQRERWHLSKDELFPGTYKGASFELMVDFRRAIRKHKLPRYVYASIMGEPKPIFIDCENYFLIEMLLYFMFQKDELVLVEMLPTPDQLWLKDGSDRYCAELRLSCCYPEPNSLNS